MQGPSFPPSTRAQAGGTKRHEDGDLQGLSHDRARGCGGGRGQWRTVADKFRGSQGFCACHFKGPVPLSSSAIIRRVNNVVSKGEENTEKTVEG